MKVSITSKKVQVNQAFTNYAEKRLSDKLDKFFGEEADAKVTVTLIKDLVTLEVTVKYDNMIYRAEQSAADKNDALDADIDKIIRQIRKNKTRLEKRLRENAFADGGNEPDEPAFEIIKRKQFVLRPMNVDEAILQMNMLGHTFFMFKNGDTGATNVVYKRDDGNYAVLEPVKD